jgi:hypothetical protein
MSSANIFEEFALIFVSVGLYKLPMKTFSALISAVKIDYILPSIPQGDLVICVMLSRRKIFKIFR